MHPSSILKKDLASELEIILQDIFKEDSKDISIKCNITLQVFFKDLYVYDLDDLLKAYYSRIREQHTQWTDYKDFIKGYEKHFLGY